MHILLIGYGKMGKAIAPIAESRGHKVTIADRPFFAALSAADFAGFDVAIEFTRPDSAFENVKQCMLNHLPVVCGTTGWNEKIEEAERICLDSGSAMLQSSNFSLGVNLFFFINRAIAHLMNKFPAYEPEVWEAHHLEKKDAPSGTAITTAQLILKELDAKESWMLAGQDDNSRLSESNDGDSVLPIIAERIAGVPGTHTVSYKSAEDTIAFTHTAHSRSGFATGAVLAAEFLAGKKGVFSMNDVLGLAVFKGFR
ncbi:MAG: 4-hydroxy-tetrahydrodipicolinate reductase [Bacteroidota bacterium]